jgi:hypothetical protein
MRAGKPDALPIGLSARGCAAYFVYLKSGAQFRHPSASLRAGFEVVPFREAPNVRRQMMDIAYAAVNKARVFIGSFRHPSASLRAGFEVVPFHEAPNVRQQTMGITYAAINQGVPLLHDIASVLIRQL